MTKRLISVEVILSEGPLPDELLVRTETQIAGKQAVMTTSRYYRDELKASFDDIWERIAGQIKRYYGVKG